MAPTLEEIEQRLIAGDKKLAKRIYEDTVFWSEHFSTIIDRKANPVRFKPFRAQLKIERALREQDQAEKPMRAIVLKARRTGASTWNVNKLMHRLTLRPNRRGLVVAQDNATASEIFSYAELIYKNLPETGGPLTAWIKPPTVNWRSSTGGEKYIHWGEPGRDARARGQRGLDSRLQIDTASETSAGRGMRITDLLCSEVAHWPGEGEKALALMSTVPETQGTLIVEESTALGMNHFHTSWNNAVSGKSGFAPVFLSWLDDPDNRLAFDSPDKRREFAEQEYGRGVEGADEERLMELMRRPTREGGEFGMTEAEAWERLHWRRQAIYRKAKGDLSHFKQEFPSTPLEAFIGSGKHVFSISFIEKAEEEAKLWNRPDGTPAPDPTLSPEDPQPGVGLLVASDWARRPLVYGGEIEVPTGSLWVPESPATDPDKPRWHVWKHPEKGGEGRRPGSYVAAVDVAAGEEVTSSGDSDFHAIQVIDHSTGEQCAEWRSRIDRDLLPLEVFLAGLYWNEALVAVEVTGGYGIGTNDDLRKKLGYKSARLLRRYPVGVVKEKRSPNWGWDTTRKTKPAMEDALGELLREGARSPDAQVIRSLRLVQELKTYVRHDNGRHGADSEQHDDLVMSFMIAQRVREMIRLPAPVSASRPTSLPKPKTGRYGR